MTFEEIQDEVIARGFKYLNNPDDLKRLERWINNAYEEVCEDRAWPFLWKDVEETAPLEIEDLGHVTSVLDLDTETPLTFVEREVLTRYDTDIFNREGTPEHWYLDSPKEIKVYPKAADTLWVTYLRVPEVLANGDDKPIIPEQYHELLVSGAVARAYRVTSNWEAYALARQDFKDNLKRMRKRIRIAYDRPRMMVKTGRAGDYLG